MAYNKKLLYVSEAPTWITEAGSLGSFTQEGNPISNINLSAAEYFNDVITYTVTSGSLPTGLSLNSSTGVISGTLTGYTATETVSFTIKATDSEGETATRDFSLNIIPSYQINYLVVAGGGGGGGYVGGGGGGGGFIESSIAQSPGFVRNIVVGAGASTISSNVIPSASGTNSSFYNITSIGGGGASNYADGRGSTGGSGGGNGGMNSQSSISANNGTAGQGFASGSSTGARSGDPTQGSGGGGAGGVGGNANGNADITAPNGGPGKQSTVCPFGYYYSGGGGAGLYNASSTSGTAGNGGIGGAGGGGHSAAGGTFGSGGGSARNNGGNGISADVGGGGNGGANTGGGGGGAGHNELSGTCKGGSGIVILRMPTISYSGTTTGSPTVTTDGTDTILTYTGSGTYTT